MATSRTTVTTVCDKYTTIQVTDQITYLVSNHEGGIENATRGPCSINHEGGIESATRGPCSINLSCKKGTSITIIITIHIYAIRMVMVMVFQASL